MRSRLLVLVVAMLSMAGCTARVGGDPSESPTTASNTEKSGPVDLAVPIDLQPVLAAGSPEATVTTLPAPEGEQLALGEPILTIDRLTTAEVKVEPTSGSWVLNIGLTDADSTVFGDWTGSHINERLALVADDEILMAPTIQSAITGGEVQIAGNYTRKDVEDLLAKITGK